MKHLPNFLSCLRVALSIMLIFLTGKPLLFVAVYLLCGISDVGDGYLARRLKVESNLGAKLDSLGDFFFYVIASWLMVSLVDDKNKWIVLIVIMVVVVVRIGNLLFTKIKFKQWSGIHTLGNKLAGLVVFVLIPVCVAMNEIPLWAILPAGTIIVLSALEETLILIKDNDYNINRRSIFCS